MTDKENDTTEKGPGQESPSGLSGIHPLSQATAALHICFHPVSAEVDLEALTEELVRALATDNIDDINDANTILAMQSRVMNAIFTRLLIHAFPQEHRPDMDYAKAAFIAQRQCANTIDKLKRHSKKPPKTAKNRRTD